jgi:hypothetical protein
MSFKKFKNFITIVDKRGGVLRINNQVMYLNTYHNYTITFQKSRIIFKKNKLLCMNPELKDGVLSENSAMYLCFYVLAFLIDIKFTI